jgi:hypothetical protein
MNMGDAMMNRPLIARRKTVLRHRQRNSTPNSAVRSVTILKVVIFIFSAYACTHPDAQIKTHRKARCF